MAMPVKAPPPPPSPPSWWSGFVEVDAESDLINPSGQNLIKGGAATLVAGLNLTLYKDKAGFINNVTVGGLYASDWSGAGFGSGSYWNGGGNVSPNGALFDTVLNVNASVTFGQYWTLKEGFYNVISNDVMGSAPCALTVCSGFPTLVWNELTLSLNDSFTGWPITFNPYVTWYYELNSIGSPPDINGPGQVSAACFSCTANSSEFFIGIVPTLGLEKYWGIPITLKAPTYITVGPESFWGSGSAASIAVFGPSNSSIGMFTTGLTAIWAWNWMPAQYGHWYAKAGFQWYDVINDALQGSNAISLGCTSSSCTQSIFVGFGGIGVAF